MNIKTIDNLFQKARVAPLCMAIVLVLGTQGLAQPADADSAVGQESGESRSDTGIVGDGPGASIADDVDGVPTMSVDRRMESKAAEVNEPNAAAPLIETLCFLIFGGMTVVSAVGICVSKDVVRMAFWLFGTLGSVAVLYFLLAAPFVAAIQLIVYAGGTLVLLVFGVMLTTKSPWVRFDTPKFEMIGAGVVCVLLALGLIGVMGNTQWHNAGGADAPMVADLGKELLTTYLVPFEAASVLLLVVMIGAAYLARQEEK